MPQQSDLTHEDYVILRSQIDHFDFSEIARRLEEISNRGYAPTPATLTHPGNRAQVTSRIIKRNLTRLNLAGLYEHALAGAILADLDADTFGQASADFSTLAKTTKQVLQVCALPDTSVRQCDFDKPASHSGMLANFLPTFQLMLAVTELNYRRHDVPRLLSVLHLMSDHAGLLALRGGQSIHPLDLQVLATGVTAGGNRSKGSQLDLFVRHNFAQTIPGQVSSDGPKCESKRDLGAYFGREGYRASSERSLLTVVADRQTHMSTASMQCLGLSETQKGTFSPSCPHSSSCTVATNLQQSLDPSSATKSATAYPTKLLAARMTLARYFSSRKTIMLRHHNPTGHFFQVPERHSVQSTWKADLTHLNKRWRSPYMHYLGQPVDIPKQIVPREHESLPGLGSILGIISGQFQPLQPLTIFKELQQKLEELLNARMPQ